MTLRASGSRIRFAHVRLTDLVLWYLIGAVFVHILPSLHRLDGAPWTLPSRDEMQAWYWTIAYMLAAAGVTIHLAMRGSLSIGVLAALGVWPWVLALSAMMVRSDIGLSRVIALESVILGAGWIMVPALLQPRIMRFTARTAAVLVLVGGMTTTAKAMKRPPVTPSNSSISVIPSTLIPLAVTYEKRLIPRAGVRGGALASYGSRFLLVTGPGIWYELTWDSAGAHLKSRRLSIPVPMNRNHGMVDKLDVIPRPPLMRVTSVVVDTTTEPVTLYSVHEAWRAQEQCFVVEVSSLKLRGMEPVDSAWKTIYDTKPCMKPKQGYDRWEGGGRLVKLRDGSLLLSVGDYGLNKDTATALSQQRDGDYGKIIRIAPDGSASIYSMGHRNPQGLTVDASGRVWGAEHGPKGGDEINLIERGANYGWPYATYGTDYGAFKWRFSAPTATHKPFREPVLSLVPSLGISNVIAIRGRELEPWRGDLLVGSLRGNQLVRVRLTGDRVAYAEQMNMGRRIRDLAEGPDGRIVMWADGGDVIWMASAGNVSPEFVAYQPCGQCHGFAREGAKDGPNLEGLLGRIIASDETWEYSEGLQRVGGGWTRAKLDAFLKDPAAFAPGTPMAAQAIPDSARRRLVVDYLVR